MRSDLRRWVFFFGLAFVVLAPFVAADAIRGAFPRLRSRAAIAVTLIVTGPLALFVGARADLAPSTMRAVGLPATFVFGATLGIAGTHLLALPWRRWWRARTRAGAEAKPANDTPDPPRIETTSASNDPEDASGAAVPRLGRRALLERAAAVSTLAIGGAPALVGVFRERTDYEATTVAFRLPQLDPGLDGFRLLQLSDLHFGTYVGEGEAREALAHVRAKRPDAIVLTGDLVDHSTQPLPELGRLVAGLRALAPHGVYVILGNHDVWTDADAVLRTVRAAGATTLVNEHVVLGAGGRRGRGFVLGGVDDVWHHERGGADVVRTFEGADPALARVLLCHNPEYFPEAAPHVDLQLSGHTHGGQVSVADVNVARLFGYERVAGRYRLGGASLYVNRGFGTFGLPIRFGARPEITEVVLTRSG